MNSLLIKHAENIQLLTDSELFQKYVYFLKAELMASDLESLRGTPDLVDGGQPVFCTLLKAIFSVVGVCFNTPELRFLLQAPLIEGSGYEKFEIMTFTSGFKMENCCFRSVPLTRRLATLWTGMSNTPKVNDKQWKFTYCFKGYAFILFIITMNHSLFV